MTIEQTSFVPKPVVLVLEPTVAIIAEMRLHNDGALEMADWVKAHRPECTPADGYHQVLDLMPHDGVENSPKGPFDSSSRKVTDNELLVELAGRSCYASFAEKAGQKTNREYIENTQSGEVKHSSIMYHAKMSFFIGGVSRRVSHELIRNYVGADRTEEGAPSQESTRFTHHYGHYIVHPRDLDTKLPGQATRVQQFKLDMQANYDSYCRYINDEVTAYLAVHERAPFGIDRKRIYEAASQRLAHSCETSFVWTTNPVALAKLFKERCDNAADLEFQRLAKKWRKLSYERWPNLFPSLREQASKGEI